MPASKWKKRPVVIEAIQYDGTAEGRIEVVNFGCGQVNWSGTDGFGVETLEGRMKISPGDWVLRGVKGEFYPCKPDIFAELYDPA